MAAATIGSKVYLAGGYNGSIRDELEVYDPAQDGWTTGPDMPTARWCLGGTELNNKLFTMGPPDYFLSLPFFS